MNLGKMSLSLTLLCAGALVDRGPAQAQTYTPILDPIPALIPFGTAKAELRSMADGLTSPVASAVAPGHTDTLFVADEIGKIWAVDVKDRAHELPGSRKRLFADLGPRMVPLGIPGFHYYDERGLLGLAFHPDFANNGLFYTFTSEPADRPADFSTLPPGVAPNCQSVVAEWRVKSRQAAALMFDPTYRRELLRIDKPQLNHNGGALAFGADGKLYISVGDGGNADDLGVGHVAGGNGQSLAPGNVLGKILRIDPDGSSSTNGQYGVPGDDALVCGGGEPEIYAYGFRNPWRMSFDPPTGRLLVGDVGQNDVEEIDSVVAGGNYGWPRKEGTFLFADTLHCNRPMVGDPANKGCDYQNSPNSPAGLLDPIAQYDHADGPDQPELRVAIVGGFVSRGSSLNALKGHYVFGDYSQEIAEPVAGHLYYLDASNQVVELRIPSRIVDGATQLGIAVLGIGQDASGELYVFGNDSGTLQDANLNYPGRGGVIFKLVPAPGPG